MRPTPLRARYSLLLVVVTALAAVAPACEPSTSPEYGVAEQAIYYGSREPITLSMTEGQKLAIGWLHWAGNPRGNFCTGTIIAPRIVATARHCVEDVGSASYIGFGVGLYPSQAQDTFRVSEFHMHPYVDAAILVLAEDATAAVPALEPIPMNRVSPSSLRGQQVDASGYGQTHDNSTGRYFAAVWLEYVSGSYVQVNGRGVQGICFGDSGGPLLAPGPVILAVESAGSETCVGEDTMTRLDAIQDWVDDIASGGGDTTPAPCDGLDYLGRCSGDVAEWCDSGQLRQYDCSTEGKSCGYVNAEMGYYCIDGTPDTCGGLDGLGRCVGTVSEWCEGGEIRSEDCAERGMLCDYVDSNIGWTCVDPPAECGDVGPTGRCDGDVAVGCDESGRFERDCAAEGLVCAWSGDDGRFACVPSVAPPTCAGVGSNGRCDGDVLVWCGAGEERQRDCAASDQVCVTHADGSHGCEDAADAPSMCGPADEGCAGGVARLCVDGAIVTESCTATGAMCVHQPPASPYCWIAPDTEPAPEPVPVPGGDDGDDGGDDPSGDPGTTFGGDDGTGDADGMAEDAGSGCTAGGRAAPPWPVLLLLPLALVLRRRSAHAA